MPVIKRMGRVAALGTALCLAGCAAGSRNRVLEPQERPEGVIEEPYRYISVGCAHFGPQVMQHEMATHNARTQLGEHLTKKGASSPHDLVLSRVLRVWKNAQGRTCVELEMPKGY